MRRSRRRRWRRIRTTSRRAPSAGGRRAPCRGIGAPADTNEAFPNATCRPSTVPSMPAPCCSTTSVGNVRTSPCSRAARTIDCGQHVRGYLVEGGGQSEQLVARSMSSNTSTSATCGMPAVSVPVLSNSSTFPCASVSSAPPPFTMIPRRAAREMPATTAIGTARINGQGVATTSTLSARTGSPDRQPGGAGDRQRDGYEDHAHSGPRPARTAPSASPPP